MGFLSWIGVFGRLVLGVPFDMILEGGPDPDMVREEARRTLLREYDKWAKDHADDATKRGAWSFSRICKRKERTFWISMLLAATSGQPSTAGFITQVG
jgi:hypothetical protein